MCWCRQSTYRLVGEGRSSKRGMGWVGLKMPRLARGYFVEVLEWGRVGDSVMNMRPKLGIACSLHC